MESKSRTIVDWGPCSSRSAMFGELVYARDSPSFLPRKALLIFYTILDIFYDKISLIFHARGGNGINLFFALFGKLGSLTAKRVVKTQEYYKMLMEQAILAIKVLMIGEIDK